MRPASDELIVVTGATGAQGGATARSLLAAGRRVRILTRNPTCSAACALTALGAQVVAADFDDPASIREALAGATGLFSMQNVGPNEMTQGQTLVAEARRTGVQQIVHTSVTGTAEHTAFPGWGSGRWMESYWNAKWSIEETVRNAGFRHFTVLRPAFMMDNFIAPKVVNMFPSLAHGTIASALKSRTILQLISAEDIGRFAAAAFMTPQVFNGRSIDLAAEGPSVAEIAGILSRELSRAVNVVELTPEQAISGGLFPGWVRS